MKENELSNMLNVGDKVYFEEEKKPYKVKAIGDRFIILTKPFNLRHTYFYTIIDNKYNFRSSDDRLFSEGYSTTIDCEKRLKELESGEIKLSRRNKTNCNIVKIKA